MPKIKQYGAELTRKKNELFRIDIDSNTTKDLHLKLSEGQDDNNPMITIVFKPEDIAGKKQYVSMLRIQTGIGILNLVMA
jgi:hypothetical protein